MTARTASIVGTNIGKLQFGENVRQVKTIVLETAATADAGDTLDVTYSKYGITTVLGVEGWKHTTDNSVCVSENPTTVLSSTGVMRLTYPLGTNDDKRLTKLYYI